MSRKYGPVERVPRPSSLVRRPSCRGGRVSAPVKPRAPHLGPERRRPGVLDAAMRLLLERGYEGASMAAIAEAAGVSKPVVYDCYPGKEELFKALFQREETRVMEGIAAAFPADADPGADPTATLGSGFTAFLRAVAASPDVYRLIFLAEGGISAAVAHRVRRGREEQVALVAGGVAAWLPAREGADDARRRLAAEIVVALGETGARILLREPGEWTPETLGPALARAALGAAAAL